MEKKQKTPRDEIRKSVVKDGKGTGPNSVLMCTQPSLWTLVGCVISWGSTQPDVYPGGVHIPWVQPSLHPGSPAYLPDSFFSLWHPLPTTLNVCAFCILDEM